MLIGVLALQGDFEAHQKAFQELGVPVVQVRQKNQLSLVDGLVIPGGESTTMLKLIHLENLLDPLKDFGLRRPVFGTCAGAILLANEVHHPEQESLGIIDIAVERNAYGRQVHSQVTKVQMSDGTDLEAVFIRAPIIRSVGQGVHILATHTDNPVLVEQGRHLAATFHPELTSDRRLHKRFLDKIRACQG
ncbi:MAG: pyridoxal 5'-phosphate synthase glutaminase subunit PdxT [Bryobacterales bacterium]|nr:pyridoxal 5'-phosphate synthase glutaminase subunit PdxT [Bryobacterales bacterium]